MKYKGDVSQQYWVAAGPFGGRAASEGDKHLLRVMAEGDDQDGWGVRMTAKTIAGPFPSEERAGEVLSSILMACPEYRADDQNDLPTWEMNAEEIAQTRQNMGLAASPA